MLRDVNQTTLRKLSQRVCFGGSRTLEIGCGAGRVTAMYAAQTLLTVGAEPDVSAASQARADIPEACFISASGANLPLADNSFDVVLFSLSLHHHPDVPQALAEAERVLAVNGRILVLEPTPESEIQRLCKVFEDEDHQLGAVESVLAQTELTVFSRDTFQTRWVFADFDEVALYGFGYYNHAPDERKRLALQSFLGAKANDRPLHMTDTLRLTCLTAH